MRVFNSFFKNDGIFTYEGLAPVLEEFRKIGKSEDEPGYPA